MHTLICVLRITVVSLPLLIGLFSDIYQSGSKLVYAHGGSEEYNCVATSYHLYGQTHGGIGDTSHFRTVNLEEAWIVDNTPAADLAVALESRTVAVVNPAYNGHVANELYAPLEWIIAPASRIPTDEEETVAILIVDDFENPNPTESHGRLVHHIAEAATRQIGMIQNIQIIDVNIGLRVDLSEGQTDYSGHYRTDVIHSELDSAIESLMNDNIRRFVVNMSFALIPCLFPVEEPLFDFFEFLNWHEDNPTLPISVYLDTLTPNFLAEDGQTFLQVLLTSPLGDDGEVAGDEWPNYLYPPGPPNGEGAFHIGQELFTKLPMLQPQAEPLDELRDVIRHWIAMNNANDFVMIPVASSGNFGGDMPFSPAGWAEVISVSASVGEGYAIGRWPWSNKGEIMVPGAWYLFEDGFYRAGTSFSAPVFSVLMAKYLTSSTVPCTFQSGVPPLAFPNTQSSPNSEAQDRTFVLAATGNCNLMP